MASAPLRTFVCIQLLDRITQYYATDGRKRATSRPHPAAPFSTDGVVSGRSAQADCCQGVVIARHWTVIFKILPSWHQITLNIKMITPFLGGSLTAFATYLTDCVFMWYNRL